MGACGWIYEDQVAPLNPPVDHAVVTNPQKEGVVRRDEHPIHHDEPLSIFGREYGFGRVQPTIQWDWLCLTDRRESSETQSTRPARFAGDVPLERERLQDVHDRFGGLEFKTSADLPDAWLICVLSQKVDQVVIDSTLDCGQRFGHHSTR